MLLVVVVFNPLFEALIMINVFRGTRQFDDHGLTFNESVDAYRAFVLDLRLAVLALVLPPSFFHVI